MRFRPEGGRNGASSIRRSPAARIARAREQSVSGDFERATRCPDSGLDERRGRIFGGQGGGRCETVRNNAQSYHDHNWGVLPASPGVGLGHAHRVVPAMIRRRVQPPRLGGVTTPAVFVYLVDSLGSHGVPASQRSPR